MRILIRFLSLALTLSTPLAFAQTYTPKAIHIDASGGVDTAEALRIVALKSPGSLTKEEIEAGLQRLADTGMYADISYKVNSEALTITLTPSASSQLQPVIFANFVWWQPAELESLVEARVPAYHGKLPAAGTLTEQVEAALVALLHEKGIDAKVEARETGMSAGKITLSISSPLILIGKLDLQNSLPALSEKIGGFTQSLQGEDFDIGPTTKSLQDSVNDIYQNAGYLDAATGAPSYGPPHKDAEKYVVDLTASVKPGDIYRIAAMDIHAAPPVSQADLTKAAEIKPGDPASPLAQRIAKGEMEKAYREAGYFDAQANFKIAKDNSSHKVSYAVTVLPGEPYHFGSLDVSALSPDQQAAYTRAFHLAPGTIAGTQLRNALHDAAMAAHVGLASNSMKIDRAQHTVAVAVKPRGAKP